MDTIFKKVSVFEETPVQEVFCLNKDNIKGFGHVYLDNSKLTFYCYNKAGEFLLEDIEFWLKEVDVPELVLF